MEKVKEWGKSTAEKDKQDKQDKGERKTQANSLVGTFPASQHNSQRFHMTPFFLRGADKVSD